VAELELELGRQRERNVEPVGRQETGRAIAISMRPATSSIFGRNVGWTPPC